MTYEAKADMLFFIANTNENIKKKQNVSYKYSNKYKRKTNTTWSNTMYLASVAKVLFFPTAHTCLRVCQ